MKNYLTLILLFVIEAQAYGHVELILPQGGEAFTVGEEVLIEWKVIIPHDSQNWDLLF